MKPGYLALYSHKYKAEKSVNYFCINLKRGGSFVSSFHCTVHCRKVNCDVLFTVAIGDRINSGNAAWQSNDDPRP